MLAFTLRQKRKKNVGWLYRDDDAHSTAFSARIRASSCFGCRSPTVPFKFGCLQDLPNRHALFSPVDVVPLLVPRSSSGNVLDAFRDSRHIALHTKQDPDAQKITSLKIRNKQRRVVYCLMR